MDTWQTDCPEGKRERWCLKSLARSFAITAVSHASLWAFPKKSQINGSEKFLINFIGTAKYHPNKFGELRNKSAINFIVVNSWNLAKHQKFLAKLHWIAAIIPFSCPALAEQLEGIHISQITGGAYSEFCCKSLCGQETYVLSYEDYAAYCKFNT